MFVANKIKHIVNNLVSWLLKKKRRQTIRYLDNYVEPKLTIKTLPRSFIEAGERAMAEVYRKYNKK